MAINKNIIEKVENSQFLLVPILNPSGKYHVAFILHSWKVVEISEFEALAKWNWTPLEIVLSKSSFIELKISDFGHVSSSRITYFPSFSLSLEMSIPSFCSIISNISSIIEIFEVSSSLVKN